MEFTTTNIITIVINVIVLIVFLVKMDSRITFQSKEHESFKIEVKELWKELEAHKASADIHFSLAVSNQVQKRTDEKFNEIEKQLSKMEQNFSGKFGELKEAIKQISDKKP